MGRIPVVESFVPGQAPQAFAKADPNMTAPLAQAGERAGAAIAGAGSDVEAFYQRKQEAVNEGKLMALQNAHQTIFEDFQGKLADPTNPENGDERTFLPRWQEHSSTALDAAMKTIGDLPPAIQTRATQLTKDWQAQSAVQVKNQVVQKEILNAKGAFDVATEKALMNTDQQAGIKTAMQLNAQAESLGFINHEQARANELAFPQKSDFNAAKTYLGEHPVLAQEALKEKDSVSAPGTEGQFVNWTHLTPDMRQTLISEASRNSAYARAAFSDKVAEVVSQGQVIPQSMMDEAAREHTANPATLKMLSTKPKDMDTDKASALMGDIAAFKPGDWKGYADLYARTNDPSVSFMKEAARSLLEKNLSRENSDTSAVVKGGLKIIDENYDQAVKPTKWVPHNNDTGEEGHRVTTPEVMKKAQSDRAALQTAFYEWSASHPNATPEDVKNFIYKSGGTSQRASVFGK